MPRVASRFKGYDFHRGSHLSDALAKFHADANTPTGLKQLTQSIISGTSFKVGWAKKTYPCDPQEVGGMINLDFDSEGRLGGIEVLGASKKLSKEVLDSAMIIG